MSNLSTNDFGAAKDIVTPLGVQKATLLPLGMVQHMITTPLPITIGGTSGRTFTLNAGVTNPVHIWNGRQYITLSATVAYSWVAGTNNILSNAGAETTLTNSTTGVWYYYIGINSSGVVTILPSKIAPSAVEGPNPSGVLGHPGTTRSQQWRYIGWTICDAATPTFVVAEKAGYWYEFADQSVATTTTWALLDFSAVLPGHGVECAGYLETSATDNDTTEVGTSSTDGRGAYVAWNAAASLQFVPFGPLVVNSDGKFYGSSTTAAGDVHVTRVRDIV